MRIWAREFKSNQMLKDTVIEDFSNETRTHMRWMRSVISLI